ncbi:SH3 domain-containing protein [Candidatus Aminicenantes bacterium AC-335-A11]|nr:SH3 domain-containing protein [SCandidatus Aminicenantes bacterium Aminicenantia_JdfR_composite]MCP2618627.1 SH3 domain-containing protein [Candidatus Aminicenantes bacterium AC-335-A11]MCP2620972.1 SH3 domain-containing protein [Candidatus Aminicenantes bacterium AC-334-E05]
MKQKNSNQITISVTLLLVFLLFFWGIIQAGNLKVRVIVDKANVRLKPSLNSQIISKVPLGAILESEGKFGEWYRVNLPPDEYGFVVSGYIHESVVEVVEEIPKVPQIKEEKPSEVTPPIQEPVKKPTKIKEMGEKYEPQKTYIPKKEPMRKLSFRAGLGLSFPSGDWAELFRLGLGLSVGNGYTIVRQPMFDVELLGSLEAHIFFREAGYADISWTRIIGAGDCRFNFNIKPITVFAQGGLGLYLDILEITVWWWKETGSELRIGPRIGGGIAYRNLEVVAMYHMVEDSMFIVIGSVIYRF